MAIRWPLLVRKTHKWLALFVGIQVVLWTVTGFYMVTVHIDYIHGDHLVRAPSAEPFDMGQMVAPAAILASYPQATELRLHRFLGQPVWRADTAEAPILLDGRTGKRLPELSLEQVRQSALQIYTGDPTIVSMKRLTQSPIEMQTRKPPYWQVEFKGWNRPTLYISPTTGELISRRHNLWRIFDFAWMLHIMDYDERSNVNNPLLRIATWSAFAMAISGAWLLLWSFPRRKRKKI
jgi:uncharacterized iron-regulated membrane protein